MIIGFNAATLGAPVHQMNGTMPVALANDGGLAFTHLLGPAWNDQTSALSTYLRTFQPSSFTDLVFVRHAVGLGVALAAGVSFFPAVALPLALFALAHLVTGRRRARGLGLALLQTLAPEARDHRQEVHAAARGAESGLGHAV